MRHATFPELDALRAARAARLVALSALDDHQADPRLTAADRRTIKALDAEITALEQRITQERLHLPGLALGRWLR